MPVTVQDFLDLMPLVADRGWRVDHNGEIRDRDGRCPICALGNEILGTDQRNGTLSGFPGRTQGESDAIGYVIFAADYPEDNLRPALMRALGMK